MFNKGDVPEKDLPEIKAKLQVLSEDKDALHQTVMKLFEKFDENKNG